MKKEPVPTDPAKAEVHKLKQQYLYSVLHDKVQTSKGREIVRKHLKGTD